MNYQNHHLKRLQHPTNPHSHYCWPASDVGTIEETIQNFSQSFNRPVLLHARRGGGGGGRIIINRSWNPSTFLRKRTIHYDLAESFMDHSTNPLSSELYKSHFKHSTKPWPNGRFVNYKEKLDLYNGNLIHAPCIKTFPVVSKQKKLLETIEKEQNSMSLLSTIDLLDPVVHEQRKKLSDEQKSLYDDFYRSGKSSEVTTTSQIKKINSIHHTKISSVSMGTVNENEADDQ
ncbi:hypothetical protein I4U23_024087 [Adineta vaga]|nr:hypothetical protein I4U23_024087 [Adineta vaga]